MRPNDAMTMDKELQKIGIEQSWPNKQFLVTTEAVALFSESWYHYQIMSKDILNIVLGILEETSRKCRRNSEVHFAMKYYI
jgi:hypothetical protein